MTPSTVHAARRAKGNVLQTSRRAHYLKENSRSETIHQCVWYDCETAIEVDAEGVSKHVLVFGWAAYRRRRPSGEWTAPQWMRFTTGEQLWTWINSLSRAKKTLYVWAHNQYFDYTATSGSYSLSRLNWKMVRAIIDSPPFLLTWVNGSRKLLLADTLNIWRYSLLQMGKLTGLEKLSMPSSWVSPAEGDAYCRRDVEIIMKGVCDWSDFLVSQDMGKFCLTVASQSMQTFRHRYLEDNILIDDNLEGLRIARASYRGGRVECARIGQLDGPLYLLDINSLYPYCMAAYEYPVKLIGVFIKPSVVELRNLLPKYLVCTRVCIEVKSPAIAIREDGKLIFPTGHFHADVTTPELTYLLEQEQVLGCKEIAVYEKARPFVQFVTDLYERKVTAALNDNLVESGHYKLLLNSFSGKWGQNGIKWTTVGHGAKPGIRFFRSIDAATNEVIDYREWDGLIQRRDTFPEAANSCPAIAAHITAYGRMVLFALMRKLPPKTYFYCDTDSVLVSKEGYEHLKESISPVVLGGLKLVGEYSQGAIYGCKDYVLDGVRTIKGIRDKAVEVSAGKFEQLRWIGFRSALRSGRLDAPRMFTQTKLLKREYTKGVVGTDGWVTPFSLS